MSGRYKVFLRAFYGSRLFLKFFLWFWAIAIITTVLVSVYAYYFHIEPEIRQFDRVHLENLQEAAGYMAEAYEKEGSEGAAVFAIKGVDWFYDENLNNILKEVAFLPGAVVKNRLFSLDLSKRTKSRSRKFSEETDFQSFVSINGERIADLAKQIFATGKDEIMEIEGFHFQGCNIVSSSNRRYAAIRHLPWKNKKKHWYVLKRIFDALPLLILISLPLCFVLGRYMARPVIEISEASRSFASGDLSTRVASSAQQRYDEIGDLATDFNQMAQQLESMIKGQQKLLGDISHELRSPLARLQVAVEILAKKSETKDQSMIDRINIEISRLNQLIGQILELNRNGSGTRTSEPTDLQELMIKVCADAQFEASARNITISRKLNGSLIIQADRQLIEQAVENIIRNAIKYSPENSEIRVDLTKSEEKAVIKVSDQGPGIAQQHLERIFEPFYRCDDDRDRKTGGVGLGLAIAQKAVLAHGGNIRLVNLPENGLEAEIILPLQ